jgi:hypothetical protein
MDENTRILSDNGRFPALRPSILTTGDLIAPAMW